MRILYRKCARLVKKWRLGLPGGSAEGSRAFHRMEGLFLVSGWLRRPGYSHGGGRFPRFVCRIDLFLELLFGFDLAHRFFLSLDLNLLVPPYIASKTVFSYTRFRCKKCISPFIYGAKINFWLVNFKRFLRSYILEISQTRIRM